MFSHPLIYYLINLDYFKYFCDFFIEGLFKIIKYYFINPDMYSYYFDNCFQYIQYIYIFICERIAIKAPFIKEINIFFQSCMKEFFNFIQIFYRATFNMFNGLISFFHNNSIEIGVNSMALIGIHNLSNLLALGVDNKMGENKNIIKDLASYVDFIGVGNAAKSALKYINNLKSLFVYIFKQIISIIIKLMTFFYKFLFKLHLIAGKIIIILLKYFLILCIKPLLWFIFYFLIIFLQMWFLSALSYSHSVMHVDEMNLKEIK